MDKPSLLLLCGDHGMSEQGSHGGSSPSETTTPLILMSSAFNKHQGEKNLFQKATPKRLRLGSDEKNSGQHFYFVVRNQMQTQRYFIKNFKFI